jgi:hypothetical protein
MWASHPLLFFSVIFPIQPARENRVQPLCGPSKSLMHCTWQGDDGYTHVKIVVSGGFTAKRISKFEACEVPVDVYGVGSSLMKGSSDPSANVVLRKAQAYVKAGRRFNPNARLQPAACSGH